MIRIYRRVAAFILCVMIIVSLPLCTIASEEGEEITILFTHDLHSHFLPTATDDGGESGGYARLMTRIREQLAIDENAVLLDAGDFSMGSLFQTAFTTSALELRIMGAMGYDVTTFGNHEYDYLPAGLADMLHAAKSSGDRVPAIVDANYLPPEDAHEMQNALDEYGVKEYLFLEREGVVFAVFGLTGYDSHACSPNSGMVFEEPAVAAQRVVDAAREECMQRYGTKPVVIALSHSGTSDGSGEDVALAKAVDGIDVIISGHSHTVLEEPIRINDTLIVSAGEYSMNLGVLKLRLTDSGIILSDYELLPVDETVAGDEQIAALIESYKRDVEENYLSDYGMTFDQVLVTNSYSFDDVDTVYAYAHESTLGNLFSDAYRWAVEQESGKPVDVALTASGVIRDNIHIGDVTVASIFNSASLGVGTEGELVAVYLTGKDLKTALEVDASIYPLMNAAQLFCSGVKYSFNTNRMIFNKVDYAMLRRDDGTVEEIEDEELYRLTCGMYIGQMLGSVESTSMGLLSITPRDRDGNPIAVADLFDYVVRDENGNPIKEWYAIASYLQQMGGTMDSRYASTDGRKVVYSSLRPTALLQNANIFTYAVLGLIALIAVLIIAVTSIIIRKRKKQAHIHEQA